VNSVTSAIHGGGWSELIRAPLTGNGMVHKACLDAVVWGYGSLFLPGIEPWPSMTWPLAQAVSESPLPTQSNFTVQSGHRLQYQALKYSFQRIICLCYA